MGVSTLSQDPPPGMTFVRSTFPRSIGEIKSKSKVRSKVTNRRSHLWSDQRLHQRSLIEAGGQTPLDVISPTTHLSPRSGCQLFHPLPAPLLHSLLLSSSSDSAPGGPEQNKAGSLVRRRRVTLCMAIVPPPGKHGHTHTDTHTQLLDLNNKNILDHQRL